MSATLTSTSGKPARTPRSHDLADALLDGRNELLGDDAADDLVREHEALAALVGLDAQLTWPYCPWPPVCLMCLYSSTTGLRDGLAVGDLGLADVGLDLELALHAVDDDLEVQLAHAADDGLAGLFVGVHAEGRILDGELVQRQAQLV